MNHLKNPIHQSLKRKNKINQRKIVKIENHRFIKFNNK